MEEQIVRLIGSLTLLLQAKVPGCRVSWEDAGNGTLRVHVDTFAGGKRYHAVEHINQLCALDGAGLIAVRTATFLAESLRRKQQEASRED